MIERVIKFLRGAVYYPYALYLRWCLAMTRKFLLGPHAWSALDRLGVPGFGTDLIRIDFPPPVKPLPRWGYGKPVHEGLAQFFGENADEQLALLKRCLARAGECLSWPECEDPSNPSLPWRDNMFLPLLDAVSLFGVLREMTPRRYVEIGSGISTRVAWQAREAGMFPMEIVSIDPCPRVDVARLCDRIHRCRLEDMPAEQLIALSGEGTVLFFDGSHRCFPGSDVTVFFLEILPKLRAGTVVQIHDIYLPGDYSARVGERYWSEQYLLAAYFLGGGQRMRILLPCHHLASEEPSRTLIMEKLGGGEVDGFSFWLQMED